jgi:hypothetical protein
MSEMKQWQPTSMELGDELGIKNCLKANSNESGVVLHVN